MKAQFVNEDLGDILKGKSKEEIHTNLMNDPKSMLKANITKTCMDFWENQGIKFGEQTTLEEVKQRGFSIGVSNDRVRNGQAFIATHAYLSKTQNTIYNDLFGYVMLKDGTFSEKINSISAISLNMGYGDDIKNYIL